LKEKASAKKVRQQTRQRDRNMIQDSEIRQGRNA
jgi:hypothetical protein